MASTKISALASGTTAAAPDLFVVARGSANYKLTTAQVFSETLTRSAFETKRAASGLVPGRWYRVTGCGSLNNRSVLVLAVEADQRSHQVVLDDAATGASWCDWADFTDDPALVTDRGGNRYHRYFSGSGLPPLNNGEFSGCYLNAQDGDLSMNNADQCNVRGTEFFAGSYNLINATVWNTRLNLSTIANANDTELYLWSCNFTYSTLATETKTTLNSVTLNNCQLTTGGGEINIFNSHFQNVNLQVINNATVENLTIIGRYQDGENMPTYIIDGNYQGKVVNNWAGHVVADRYRGSSTVRAFVTVGNGSPLTYDATNKIVALPDQSPIGVVLMRSITTGNKLFQYVKDITNNDWHAVEFRLDPTNVGTWELVTTTDSAITVDGELVKPHGGSAKLGQLQTLADFAVLRKYQNLSNSVFAWAVVDGAHYD